MMRVGIGYDVHKLVDGRKLFLGGVEIPYAKGLLGHSDADVVLHALCDALLGAAGRGDIGEHFPDTDAQYAGISSSLLLKRINELVLEDGWRVGNVDIIIHAQEPKLADYKKRMRFHVAFELAIDEKNVNIKATTHEHLGAIGRREGIAATAVVLLIPMSDR